MDHILATSTVKLICLKGCQQLNMSFPSDLIFVGPVQKIKEIFKEKHHSILEYVGKICVCVP